MKAVNGTAKATLSLVHDPDVCSVKPLGHPVLFPEDIWAAPKQTLRDETWYSYNGASEDPGTGSGSVKAKTRPMEL